LEGRLLAMFFTFDFYFFHF